MEKLLIASAIAMLLGFALTAVCIKVAPILGLMDIPKDDRRMHKDPTPRMGGVAIYLAFCIALSLCGYFFELVPFAIGGLILVVTGIMDDKYGLKPWMKIVGQALAGVVLCAFGITAGFFDLRIFSLDAWYFAYPLTVIWVIAVTNFYNLIDGIDGLCTGITVFGCGGIALCDALFSGGASAPIAIAFICACIGFLPHNTSPAKIFLGDTGSMLCGFMLAALSCEVFFSAPAEGASALFALSPILLLGIPIFDTCFAIIRRLANGTGIFVGDKKHVHHRLTERYGSKGAVLVLYAAAAVLVGIAIVMNISTAGAIVGCILGVLALAYATVRFGFYKK